MLRVSFSVEGAEVASSAASPAVTLQLRVAVVPDVPVHAVLLRCEARIEAARRGYTPGERERLFDLFGEPARHARTLRALPWIQTTLLVPAFRGQAIVDLTLPCGTDFDGSVAKYFEALDDGEVPLSLLFSGTVFHARDDGALQVGPLPWTSEAGSTLPVSVYRDAYERHHGASALLPIPRELYERLRRYKQARGAATWAQALEALLRDHEEAPR
jgi:hypothetical protein